jgi:alpha-beta hydrolase superfamily lysophospholipase
VARYRGDRDPIPIENRTVIVVDDGLATGFTARAAIEVLRRRRAGRVVLAVPVAPVDTIAELRGVADEGVCLHTPAVFWAIGEFYDDFAQTTDGEVTRLLAADAQPVAASPGRAGDDPPEPVTVTIEHGLELPGTLSVPVGATGIVVFAHGSGSSRLSPRNIAVAEVLNQAGLATLLFDLLTPDEALDRAQVFDIELLATRLGSATKWLSRRRDLASLRVGYFGASTGAAAALWAAADLAEQVGAVVSRGGRPDLAAPRLAEVRAPTLLIVGSRDNVVINLNEQAQRLLRCPNELAIVPGATHLFEEPGALEHVAGLAADWFTRHLTVAARPAGHRRHPQPT